MRGRLPARCYGQSRDKQDTSLRRQVIATCSSLALDLSYILEQRFSHSHIDCTPCTWRRRPAILHLWLSCRQSSLFFFFFSNNQKTFSIRCISVAWLPQSPLGRQIDLSHRAVDCRRAKVAGPLTRAGAEKGWDVSGWVSLSIMIYF